MTQTTTTQVVTSLPTLYSLSSTGKVKTWSVSVLEYPDGFKVCSSHGYKDQIITCDYSSFILGKNIGRKNETTPCSQAILEAAAKHQKKLDKNYSETIPTSVDEFSNLRPMLAHKYSDRAHDLDWPVYIQPKLNGLRALDSNYEDGTVSITSRGSKSYTTLTHIEDAVRELLWIPEAPLDGEIYLHGMPLQDINAAVKKVNSGTASLEYWVYDIADTTLDYEDRMDILMRIRDTLPEDSPIKIVETILVENEEQLMAQHVIWSLKFEGTMIRNRKGKYIFDFRSVNLQKVKDFLDEEFIIVGYKSGTGSDEGTVIWRCMTANRMEFDVRPTGTREQRKEWFDNAKIYLQTLLTVSYQELSKDGVPIFPVGICLRAEDE